MGRDAVERPPLVVQLDFDLVQRLGDLPFAFLGFAFPRRCEDRRELDRGNGLPGGRGNLVRGPEDGRTLGEVEDLAKVGEGDFAPLVEGVLILDAALLLEGPTRLT